MAYRVEITARAERGADSLLSRLIAQQAGETGLHWFEGLEKAITTLADMLGSSNGATSRGFSPFPAPISTVHGWNAGPTAWRCATS